MIDIFDPVVMTEALITNFPPHMFLTNTFFSVRQTHPTKEIHFDIRKGKRRMSPFVNRLSQGKVIERIPFKRQKFEPPYIKPKRVTTAEDLLKTAVGEVVYVQDGSNAPAARATKMLAEDVTEEQMYINRRIEWMASKSLFTGKVPVKGEGLDLEIDFLFSDNHKITITTSSEKWSALTTADPLKNFSDWSRRIKQDTGKTPRVAVLGRNAAFSAERNTTLLELLDNRRTEAGMIRYEDLPDGATYMGFLPKPGIELFTYDEWYIDDTTGLEVEMVPENMVLLGATEARCRRHYGVISDVEAGNFEVETFIKTWVEKDPSARMLLLQSAPLTTIEEPDGFLFATVQDAEA